MCRQVPPAYLLQDRPPLLLEGKVVAGFGRGSRKMGVPTANIAPEPLADKIQDLPLGVYFGYGCCMFTECNTAPKHLPFACDHLHNFQEPSP